MTRKTIIIDSQNNYEMVDSPEIMVAEYNSTVTEEYLKLTVQDQIDLNEMFIEAGLLQEVEIH